MFPAELWALIFTYITSNIDLLNVSMCSKMFYVLIYKNNRYKLRLDHSKRILSSKNVFDRYLDAWISFNYQLSSRLDLTENLMFAVKNKISSL